MSEEKKSKNSWTVVIMGIVILILFNLWANQRNENESAQQEFAMQTARAENQKAISSTATQEMKKKIAGCIRVEEASRYIGMEQCVIGRIYNYEESKEARDIYTPPEFTYAFFDIVNPNTFYIISYRESHIFLGVYVNECVKVWGYIGEDENGSPAMAIFEHDSFEPYFNIERLPDEICRR